MRKFIFALALIAIASPALAQAPTSAPGEQYFMGASAGMQWRNAASHKGGINSQTGTSYTFVVADQGKLVVFNNGSAVAVTLPAASAAGFDLAATFSVLNLGAGTVTITPTTSTINGGATKTYAQNAGGNIISDGTNYFAW